MFFFAVSSFTVEMCIVQLCADIFCVLSRDGTGGALTWALLHGGPGLGKWRRPAKNNENLLKSTCRLNISVPGINLI
jgi:hypothetical protein